MYEDYTLGLALMDFVPVILSGIALIMFSKMISIRSRSAGQTALMGGLLVLGGGLCKATWKTLVVVIGQDITVLNNLLWLLMAPGFTLFFAALLQWSLHASHKAPKILPIVMSLAVFGVGYYFFRTQADSRIWFLVLLGATVLFSTGSSITLMIHSAKVKIWLAFVFLLANVVCSFTMSYLARLPEQTAALQWIEEGLNIVSQGSFLIAAIMLYRNAKTD
ncbi:MAG: hypothetical protein V7711_09020 [Pseudomonadales bacterium]